MFKLLFLLISLLFSQQISADSLNLIINGKALHEDKKDFNEENWGLGFEYNLEEEKNGLIFSMAGFLRIAFQIPQSIWVVELKDVSYLGQIKIVGILMPV